MNLFITRPDIYVYSLYTRYSAKKHLYLLSFLFLTTTK